MFYSPLSRQYVCLVQILQSNLKLYPCYSVKLKICISGEYRIKITRQYRYQMAEFRFVQKPHWQNDTILNFPKFR